MTPAIWTPEPKSVIPPGLRRPIFPGERGWAEAYRLAGLINGGMVNGGHAMVDGGVIRAHTSGPALPAVAGYLQWWDARQGVFQDTAETTPATADGATVQSWLSYGSGAAHLDYVPVAALELKTNIIGTKPVVRASGSNYMQCSYTLAQPITYFFVMVYRQDTTSVFPFDGNNGPTRVACHQNQTDVVYRMLATSNGPTVTLPGKNVVHILCCVFNGASSRVRINAGTAGTGDPGANAANGFTLAARSDGVGKDQCDYASIIVYGSALSTSDETTVRNGLNADYSVF